MLFKLLSPKPAYYIQREKSMCWGKLFCKYLLSTYMCQGIKHKKEMVFRVYMSSSSFNLNVNPWPLVLLRDHTCCDIGTQIFQRPCTQATGS